jgi:hypothetical protein
MSETLEAAAHAADKLRTDLIFDEQFDDGGAMDFVARYELLQALSLMEAAVNGLRKAAMLQTRALAAEPRSRA